MKKVLLACVLGLVLLVTSSVVTSAEGPIRSVEDSMERTVAIDGSVDVIISLAPSNTEILFALGLGDRVVGVTSFCNYPPEAADKQVVGGFADPNLELILTLVPDLVLANTMHQDVVERLEERGIPALVIDPKSIQETYAAIRVMGKAADVDESAETLVQDMQQRVHAVQERLAPVSDAVQVYYELWYDPIMTIGGQSFIHELVAAAGGENIFADIDQDYPMVSAEVVAERNPQVILYPSDHGTAEMVQEQFKARPGWSRVAALQDGQIHALNSDIINRAGPRLVQAVEAVAAVLYPDLFGE